MTSGPIPTSDSRQKQAGGQADAGRPVAVPEIPTAAPIGPDLGQKISDAYNIKGVPETFYVDKTGQLRGVQIGPLYPPTLDHKIEELLAE